MDGWQAIRYNPQEELIGYDKGFTRGYNYGFGDAYEGLTQVIPETDSIDSDYISGFEAGYLNGYSYGIDYKLGYDDGQRAGYEDGLVQNPHDPGYSHNDELSAYETGYMEAYSIGYDLGSEVNAPPIENEYTPYDNGYENGLIYGESDALFSSYNLELNLEMFSTMSEDWLAGFTVGYDHAFNIYFE